MKGFSLIEILFSLLFLGTILHLSQVIFFQTNKYNQSTLRLKSIAKLSTKINLNNKEQNLEKPFSLSCKDLKQNPFSPYYFFICKTEGKEIFLWKKKQ